MVTLVLTLAFAAQGYLVGRIFHLGMGPVRVRDANFTRAILSVRRVRFDPLGRIAVSSCKDINQDASRGRGYGNPVS